MNQNQFKAVSIFYMDDSGSRHPDHHVQAANHGGDWFALGGILINEDDKARAESLIDDFRLCWPQMGKTPFHSHEIRRAQGNFSWLAADQKTRSSFLEQLTELLLNIPAIGIACVINRPGYNLRYKEKYRNDRWLLCKTAFAVAVERAVKFATERERRLRIYVERCSKQSDNMFREYYETLKRTGLWFDATQSSKYNPVGTDVFKTGLYDFKTKTKESSLMQIADLYLWPMCIGGYDPNNRAYCALRDAGKLIDTHLPAESLEERGIKYSCF